LANPEEAIDMDMFCFIRFCQKTLALAPGAPISVTLLILKVRLGRIPGINKLVYIINKIDIEFNSPFG
jgi:hypothetical protein